MTETYCPYCHQFHQALTYEQVVNAASAILTIQGLDPMEASQGTWAKACAEARRDLCSQASPACQFCGEKVEWTRNAGYAAFTHVSTGTLACPGE